MSWRRSRHKHEAVGSVMRQILNDNGLGTCQDRRLALETANVDKALEFTAEQAAFPGEAQSVLSGVPCRECGAG